jgi:hypothetical protein
VVVYLAVVLLSQALLPPDLGEVAIETLFVAIAVEGVDPMLALSLFLPDLIVLDLR